MFFRSLSQPEQDHLVDACRFELGKVSRREIQERVIALFGRIDSDLATRVAEGLGLAAPSKDHEVSHSSVVLSPALSMASSTKGSIKTRKIAALVSSGFDQEMFDLTRVAAVSGGAQIVVVSERLGNVTSNKGEAFAVDRSTLTTASVEYDAVLLLAGSSADQVDPNMLRFIQDTFRHRKTIGTSGAGLDLLQTCGIHANRPGIVVRADGPVEAFTTAFVEAVAQHRHWDRPDRDRATPEPPQSIFVSAGPAKPVKTNGHGPKHARSKR